MTNCNFCHKKGLLIYPVRYAVASPYGAEGVPGLSGNFRIEDAPQAAGAAKYTLRVRCAPAISTPMTSDGSGSGLCRPAHRASVELPAGIQRAPSLDDFAYLHRSR
jgi:hypothetical protein